VKRKTVRGYTRSPRTKNGQIKASLNLEVLVHAVQVVAVLDAQVQYQQLNNLHRHWVNKIHLGIRKIRIKITVTFEIQKTRLKSVEVAINVMLKTHIKTLRFHLTGNIHGLQRQIQNRTQNLENNNLDSDTQQHL